MSDKLNYPYCISVIDKKALVKNQNYRKTLFVICRDEIVKHNCEFDVEREYDREMEIASEIESYEGYYDWDNFGNNVAKRLAKEWDCNVVCLGVGEVIVGEV